jgi:hypothetical protein
MRIFSIQDSPVLGWSMGNPNPRRGVDVIGL